MLVFDCVCGWVSVCARRKYWRDASVCDLAAELFILFFLLWLAIAIIGGMENGVCT